ncbi:hypothetical protein GGU11DRAFT_751431 [Lentinula aff. detonsa]|nr:hypothetical protein GGU11DRAFT_751431 [Lentinula aff. detonsa]
MDLFNNSESDSSSSRRVLRRSHRLLNVRNHRRVASDDMDVDNNTDVESSDSRAQDVIMQEANDEDTEISIYDDDNDNIDIENALVDNSDNELQNDNEEDEEWLGIDQDENVSLEDQQFIPDNHQSHFPRLFSPEVSDSREDDPHLSDSAVGPLETFRELSAREAQKQKERVAEEHSAFWTDKKEHGLEHVRDRFQRFSDEVSLRIPQCQDIPGSVEVYSEEEMEEMEKFLEDFDLSFLNSHAYYNEASHGKGKKKEDSVVPSSPPSSNLPDELDAEVDHILQDGNFTCNFELYQLRSRDLQTLNPTSWLNDSFIPLSMLQSGVQGLQVGG